MNTNEMMSLVSPMLPPEGKYVFPSAYGGVVQSGAPPQIHNMMRALRMEIGSVEAKKSTDQYGPKFPVRGAKDLNQKLANALNKLNMAAPVIQQDVQLIDADKIPKNENKSGNPVFRTLAHVTATVRLIAPDTSFVDLVGSGHGGDVDDKSGGKASTYAWKDALLKGLSIPHEDMVDTDDYSSAGEAESASVRASGTKAAAARGGGREAVVAAGNGGASSGRSTSNSEQNGVRSSGELVSGRASPSGDGQPLSEVIARIKASGSQQDLDMIRDDIKAGKIKLHGSDKLEATKVWVERQAALKKGSN